MGMESIKTVDEG